MAGMKPSVLKRLASRARGSRFRLEGPFNPELPKHSPAQGPLLAKLDLAAGVTITVDGKQLDTAALITSGNHRQVRQTLWAKPAQTADEHNNLGIAFAYAGDWDQATKTLKQSAKVAHADGDSARESRATSNVLLVNQASKQSDATKPE